MARSVPANAMLVVFCPFAAGYFLSFFFRNVNAVISADLAHEFSLPPTELGFLTSTYLLAFAAFQLPLGVLLDRYGPRRTVGGLLFAAAAGALLFALARDFAMLALGRALIGLGVSGCLMGAIKAFTMYFPLARLATLNGLFLAIGGLGALAATAPAQALLGPLGWRGLFIGLAVLSLAAAAAILAAVPEKPPAGRSEGLGAQIAAFATIYGTAEFWRIGLPLMICLGAHTALQSLWLAPWMRDVAGLAPAALANYLLLAALAYTAGSVFFGVTSDRLARLGVSRLTVFKCGLSLSLAMFVLLAAGVHTGLGAILAVYGFSAISGALAYALFAPMFGPDMAGRVNTACNVLTFSFSFVFQWGIGAVLKLYPVAGEHYAPEGYAAAFFIIAALQLSSIGWLLPMREARADASSRTSRRSRQTA